MGKLSDSSVTSNLSCFGPLESGKKVENSWQKSTGKSKNKLVTTEDFFQKLGHPLWYRAPSMSQIRALDGLINDIRDDMKQNTTHRVRLVLLRLGLHPLEPSSNLKFVIVLSRGNDLAFLWFLLELFYNNDCLDCEHERGKYSLNEQLLMSAIAHLDMITTLRELDKIVPQQGEKPKEKSETMKNQGKKLVKRKTYLSPLLEPLPRPVLRRIKTPPPPLIKTDLGYYEIYKDKHYQPPNAWNRWFARSNIDNLDFDFTRESRKVVHPILSKYVKELFSKNIRIEDIAKSICETHAHREEDEKEKKKVEKVKQRSETAEYFSADKKNNRRKLISKRIENDANRILNKQNVISEYKGICKLIQNVIDNIINNVFNNKENGSCPIHQSCPVHSPMSVSKVNGRQSKSCRKTPKCNCYQTGMSNFEFGHDAKPRPDEIYFNAPGRHQPYKFHYDKIFKDDLAEKADPVKVAVRNILDLENYRDEDEAISAWIKETWKYEVKQFNKEYEEEKIKEQHEKIKEEPKYYDPRNDELMDKMLLDAINVLRKNPKFVLASLPGVNKHPLLKRWIRIRFGLVYTRKEKENSLRESTRERRKLKFHDHALKLPDIKQIGLNCFPSYGCKGYVVSKSRHVLSRLYHNISMVYLENTRAFWVLMAPTQCTRPPVEVFYAYMPARPYDIKLFKPWYQKEYKDVEWNGLRWERMKQKDSI